MTPRRDGEPPESRAAPAALRRAVATPCSASRILRSGSTSRLPTAAATSSREGHVALVCALAAPRWAWSPKTTASSAMPRAKTSAADRYIARRTGDGGLLLFFGAAPSASRVGVRPRLCDAHCRARAAAVPRVRPPRVRPGARLASRKTAFERIKSLGCARPLARLFQFGPAVQPIRITTHRCHSWTLSARCWCNRRPSRSSSSQARNVGHSRMSASCATSAVSSPTVIRRASARMCTTVRTAVASSSLGTSSSRRARRRVSCVPSPSSVSRRKMRRAIACCVGDRRS